MALRDIDGQQAIDGGCLSALDRSAQCRSYSARKTEESTGRIGDTGARRGHADSQSAPPRSLSGERRSGPALGRRDGGARRASVPGTTDRRPHRRGSVGAGLGAELGHGTDRIIYIVHRRAAVPRCA
jgi:hypothetical protein